MMQTPLISRLRAEYLEMPGLRLTRYQIQRLCGIDPTLCQAMLDVLVETGFLCLKTDGTYARRHDGAERPAVTMPHVPIAKTPSGS
jgi:hypothetical protein